MDDLDDEQLVIAHFGAIKIQSIARMILVRSRLLRQLNERYEKIYDSKRERYYYYDSQKDKSSWQKPLLLLKSDITKISPPYVPEGEEGTAADTRSTVDDDEVESVANETVDGSRVIATDDEEEHDEDEEGGNTKSDNDASESDYSSEDSEAVRDRRRLKRKHPRFYTGFYLFSLCYLA